MEFQLVLSLIFQYTFLTAFGEKRLVSYLAVPYSLSLIKHTACTSMNEILTAGDAQVLGYDRVVPLAGHAPQVLRAVRRAQDRRRVLLLLQHHGRR